MNSFAKLRGNQKGFASIIIAMVLILVLSLITAGFAELMRKNQQQALNQQLSDQAYYAAETGVNDAAKAISLGYQRAKTNCDDSHASVNPNGNEPGSQYLEGNSTIGGNITNAKYTCLLIDPTPTTLEYSSVSTEQSQDLELTGLNAAHQPAALGFVTISWHDANGGSTFIQKAGHDFPTNARLGSAPYSSTTGVLRIALTPVDGTPSRNSLNNSTFTAFLYPNAAGAGSVANVSVAGKTGQNSGVIIDGNCNTSNAPYACNVKISGLTAINYFLDIRSIYRSAGVSIGTGTSYIANAQTLVDSTGKAEGVLKRIQVRIPDRNSYSHTDFTIETSGGGASVCKQLQIEPNSGNSFCP